MSRREEDFTVGYTRRLGDYARKFKAHKHPDPFRNRTIPGGFVVSHGDFGQAGTSSMPDVTISKFAIGSADTRSGPNIVGLAGDDLEFLLGGLYVVNVTARSTNITANGWYELSAVATFGDGITTGVSGKNDIRVSTSSKQTKVTPQWTKLWSVDAGTVVQFFIQNQSGGSRSFNLDGTATRIADSTDGWLNIA